MTTEHEGPWSAMDRLRRDPDNGKFAGVAAGIAKRTDIRPGLIRLAFILLSFVGMLGVLLYLAAWLVVPEEGEDQSVVEQWLAGTGDRNSWLGAALIGVAVLILIGSIDAIAGSAVIATGLLVAGVLLYRGTFDESARAARAQRHEAPSSPSADASSGVPRAAAAVTESPAPAADQPAVVPEPLPPPPAATTPPTPPPPPRPPKPRPPRSKLGRITIGALMIVIGVLAFLDAAGGVDITLVEYLAAATIVVGTGLLVGTFWGRSRPLIFMGLVLLFAVQTAVWFDVPITGGVGDPLHRPTALAEVEDEYRLAAGQLILDFRAIEDMGAGDVVRSEASVAAGEMIVYVPAGAGLDITTDVLIGQIQSTRQVQAGTGVDLDLKRPADEGQAQIELELAVGFGQITIVDPAGG